MKKCIELLSAGTDIRFGKWEGHEIEVINTFGMLTTKPQVVLVNMNRDNFIRKRGKHLPLVKKWVDEHCPGETMIPFSADLEKEVCSSPSPSPSLSSSHFSHISFPFLSFPSDCSAVT